jgi:hypothetical protein
VTLITTHDALLTASIESDVVDDSLWRLFDDEDLPPVWSILKERVPSSVLDLFRESVAPGYIYSVKDQARYARGEPYEHLVWRDSLPPHIADRLPHHESGKPYSAQEIFDAFFRWIHTDSEISLKVDYSNRIHPLPLPKDIKDWLFAISTSYLNGSSIAVNEAMLISDSLGSTMVTDSNVHHQMVALKYKRAAENVINRADQIPGLEQIVAPSGLMKYEYVAFNVFRYLVSDEALASMSLQQCLRYREASRDALQRLRSYLRELDAEVSANVWDKTIESQVQNLINKRIGPEARRVADELASIRTKLFGSLSATLATASIPTLIVSVYPGLHPTMSLLFGASALAGGSVAMAVKETADAIAASRNTKRNGLSYLLRVSR